MGNRGPSAAKPQLKESGVKEDELRKEFRIRESSIQEIDPQRLNTKATRKRPEVRKSRTMKFSPQQSDLNTNYANKRQFRSIDPKRKITFGSEHRVPHERGETATGKKGLGDNLRKNSESESPEFRILYPYTFNLKPNAFECTQHNVILRDCVTAIGNGRDSIE